MSPLLHASLVLLGQVAPPGARRPAPAEPSYLEILENNSHVIYPALGVLVLLLIALGIFQAWRAQDLDGLQKAELKREILIQLRKQLVGATAESLGKQFGLEPLKMMKILEEMQREGVLASHTNTQRQMMWQVKGLVSGPQKKRARG